MTKKEIRQAAKGCGFKRLRNLSKELTKVVSLFRKGRFDNENPQLALVDIQQLLSSMQEQFKIAATNFGSNSNLTASDVIKVKKAKAA